MMDINLDHGTTRRNLEDSFDWWQVLLPMFRDYLREQQ